jgi:hypothetical protein
MAKQGSPTTKGPAGIQIKTHGKYYYKTDTAKGVKSFEMVVRARSLEMFRETYNKYMGTETDPKTQLQTPKYKTNTYLNIRGQLKKRLLPILLIRKHADFARVRFVVIDEIVSETGEKLNLPIKSPVEGATRRDDKGREDTDKRR